MRSALWRATLLASLVLTMDRPTDAASGTAPVCSPVRVGLDTTQANTYLVFYTGRSYGQTFTTGDTLIESITSWRGSPTPVDNTPLRLFITEVDSAGKPDVFHIVNSSAVIVVPPGDSVHATPGVFAFSPPLALPHRGMFCFVVHDDLYCSDAEPLLGSTLDPYPNGRAWKFTADAYCENLGPPFGGQGGETDDMIFAIEFCDTSTPTLRRTWGELKALYR